MTLAQLPDFTSNPGDKAHLLPDNGVPGSSESTIRSTSRLRGSARNLACPSDRLVPVSKPRPLPFTFKWRHFEPPSILCAVRWYLRPPLSYPYIEERLIGRGLGVDDTTIWRRVPGYAPKLSQRCRRELKPTVPGGQRKPTIREARD